MSFVPKLVVVAVSIVIFGSMILGLLSDFTTGIFERIPDLVQVTRSASAATPARPAPARPAGRHSRTRPTTRLRRGGPAGPPRKLWGRHAPASRQSRAVGRGRPCRVPPAGLACVARGARALADCAMLGFGLSIEPQLWALLFVMVRDRRGVHRGAGVRRGRRSRCRCACRCRRDRPAGARRASGGVPPAQVFALTTFLSVAAEALVGLALGFVLQIAFAAPLVASEVIGTSMGIGFATAVDPQNGTLDARARPVLLGHADACCSCRSTATSCWSTCWCAATRCCRRVPPGSTPQHLKGIALFGGYAFLAGLLLALPVGFLLLCLNLVVGMLSRSAPSLNLFAVGLPVSLAVGVVALAIGFPAMGDYMLVIIREGLDATQTLVLG